MGKPILDVVVQYTALPQVVVTVSCDPLSIVLWTGRDQTLGNQAWREHYTYHIDGTLQITEERRSVTLD